MFSQQSALDPEPWVSSDRRLPLMAMPRAGKLQGNSALASLPRTAVGQPHCAQSVAPRMFSPHHGVHQPDDQLSSWPEGEPSSFSTSHMDRAFQVPWVQNLFASWQMNQKKAGFTGGDQQALTQGGRLDEREDTAFQHACIYS